MKSYIVMAYHFMEYAVRYINNIYDEDDIIDGVDIAARHFHICAHVTSGSARHAIVTDNFVIKWDMNVQCVHEIGGCENEIKSMTSRADVVLIIYLLKLHLFI